MRFPRRTPFRAVNNNNNSNPPGRTRERVIVVVRAVFPQNSPCPQQTGPGGPGHSSDERCFFFSFFITCVHNRSQQQLPSVVRPPRGTLSTSFIIS